MFRISSFTEVWVTSRGPTGKDLETYLRERLSSPPARARYLAREFGYLDYMVYRYYEILGSWGEVKELLRAFEESLNPSVRCNKLKLSDCGLMVEALGRLGYRLRVIEWCPNSYEVLGEGSIPLGATHEFLLGYYYLYRGKASLIPPLVLNPSPGDVVLDLAAAPGGKTTHMAELMGGGGVVVAIDVSRVRMRALRSNLDRLGVGNVVSIRMDGRRVSEVFGSDYFTKVLLDAPCTGEGLIQLDKGRKTRTSLHGLMVSRLKQIQLLREAIKVSAPGSLILYVTCSIAPEEDELVVSEVLSSLGSNSIEVVDLPSVIKFSKGLTEYFGIELPREVRRCGRVWPHVHSMEGYFLCLLRKLR